jgi:hypothetical protein
MREIKFRAWFEHGTDGLMKNGEMYYLAGPFFEFGPVVLFGEPGNSEHRPSTVEPIIMQYTGIRDKNGREIYEGDITEDGVGNWDKIVFEPSGYFAICRNDEDYKLIEGDRITVIGNIYENPNLLK